MNSLQNLESIIDLLRLQPVPMDTSNRLECLPETRVDLIRSVEDWTKDMSIQQSVLWLHGLAGAGKSTLATTIANRFREAGRLGAFLFFNRDVTQRSDPGPVIRTIVYQMGSYDHHIGSVISSAIENTPNSSFLTPRVQFKKLIVEPLLSTRRPVDQNFSGRCMEDDMPVVVVLDALDECGNLRTRKHLLEILAKETTALSSILRIVLTSCAESDIRIAFKCQSHIASRELDITSDTNANDILLYFWHCAKETRNA